MPPFKPLTKTALATTKPPEEHIKTFEPLTEIETATTERIRIIFDDSSSMHSSVTDEKGASRPCYELAADGTIDYMKSCTPKTTAVTIDFLNQSAIPMTRNLPAIAPDVRAKAGNGGGTPMNEHLNNLVTAQPKFKFTRALIFSDGEFSLYEQTINNVLELGIPIDFILIGDYNANTLSGSHAQMKTVCEKTKGQFLICKDGNAFKAKLKYFAPPLRYMLPQIASKES